VTAYEVLIQYEAKLQELQAGLAHVRVQHLANTAALIVAAALIVTLGVFAVRQRIPLWWPSLPIPIAAASARRYGRHRVARSRTWRLKCFYDRAVLRVKGLWPGQGFTGAEFSYADHVYANDLSIFGEGSLFELLCIARTAIGRRGLANYLLEAPSLDEAIARQEAVRELQPRSDLREKVALLGEFDSSESKWETFTEWLDSPPLPFRRSLRVVAAITSALVAGIVLAGMAGLLPWIRVAIWISPLVLFHSVVGLIFRGRVNQMIESLRSTSIETRVLREGLQLLDVQQFRSAKLLQIAERVRNGSTAVRKLEWLLEALGQRDKDWFYGPSRILLGGTQLCMAVEYWRVQHGAALRGWLDAWGEFEALNALGNYAHENRDNAFPEFSGNQARFEAVALGHPLLRSETCVRNDVQLNHVTRFYIISGSNMSGKSTLLRAIGLSAVMAFAGAPVRAQSLRLSELSVCASLFVVDSLLNGKSKFLAEVDRLRQIIQLAHSSRPVLFLIDEIFSGTNSRDRRVAAEGVVRTLVDRGTIGALSTHDISLTEIAHSEGLRGANVHMGAKAGNDPMSFDYLLKPGITMEANALAIARMAGVPV
jgi:hypothetical protein